MKPAALKVQEALVALGTARTLIELPVSARTSREAAAALGVSVAQIAKSLVFTSNGNPVLVIASGANRVDERKLERHSTPRAAFPSASSQFHLRN